MKNQKSNIIKNKKGKIKIKINREQNENATNSNTLSPLQNILNSGNNKNQIENYYNKRSESNVIANILETNEIKNDFYNNEELENKERKNNKKFSKYYNDYIQLGDFSFINLFENVAPFLYKPQQTKEYTSHAFNNFKFLNIINSYKMIINIIVDDDSLKSSINLTKIFELIILSLSSLNEIKISNKDFLVCIFFQHFSYEETFRELFPGLNFYNYNNWNVKKNNFYCSYGYVLSVNDTPINTLLFYKESSTFVEIYKFFYCYVLNDIITLINADAKEISKTFLLVNWPNGKIYEKTSNKYHKSRILSNIFRICNNRNMVLIPDINYYPGHGECYFDHINKYNLDNEKVEINLYWHMISGYPIDHRFFFINMNFKLYLILKDYYQNNNINIYANEYYHDYHLTIYLRDNLKNLVIKKIQQVKIQYSDLPFNFIDLFYDYILRRGSQYANFFCLFSYFFSWKNMNCFKFFQKIFLLFKLLNFIVQFFWLGLSFLISYAVFNDTFGSQGNNMDYFCSLGYIIIIIILLFISVIYIKNKPNIKGDKIQRNSKRNEDSNGIITALYFIHYIYSYFFIISAIIALIHIKQGKNKEITDCDYYVFDTNLYIILIIINLLLYILPSFIRPSNLISKGFIFYILIQLPNSSCFFHLPYLLTCIRNVNSKEKKKESLYITLYILLNGLLTVICLVFDTKRQRRMDFLFIILIIFTVLNGVKLIILIIGFCAQNSFNKNITTGDIPQYYISNEECDNININLNINNYINNNKLKDNINKHNKNNNNKNKLEKIINKFNNENLNLKKINYFSENGTKLENQNYLNKKCFEQKIFNMNNNMLHAESALNNFIDEDNRSSLSNSIKLKNYPIKEIDNNINNINNDNNKEKKNILKSTLDFQSVYKLPKLKQEKREFNNNINNIENKNEKELIKFPLDTNENNIQQNEY